RIEAFEAASFNGHVDGAVKFRFELGTHNPVNYLHAFFAVEMQSERSQGVGQGGETQSGPASVLSRFVKQLPGLYFGTLDEIRLLVGVNFIQSALYRSEERRVGKECRARWSVCQVKR